VPKLIVKRGLPGSGKSTSAREMVSKDGNTARINFDDLRAMLFNGKWSRQREKAVNTLCGLMIQALAAMNLNVIIDNTNLTQRHVDSYKAIAKQESLEFVEEIHPMNIEGCVFHDRLREPGKGRVGRAVIERLAISSGWFKFLPDERIWIFDVDGTLADSSHRAQAFLNIPSGDEGVLRNEWDKFFAASADDNPIEAVQKWAQEVYRSGDTVVICSGRSDDYCDVTTEWLDKHKIPFHHILMRRRGDKREDYIVKNELLNILPKQQIVAIVDDRQQVIDMWRRVRQAENLSYRVYQVAEGNF
jgi:predicted kinase